jgi:hypothetical protein
MQSSYKENTVLSLSVGYTEQFKENNMGGGGGSKTSTTTSGIAPEFIPYYEKALGIATNRLGGQFDEAGNLRDPSAAGIVAGLSDQQKAGLSGQQALAQQAMSGTGIYNDEANVQRMLQNASGAQDYAMQGALGSARGDRAKQAALADMGYQFQEGRQRKAEGGAQSMQDVGGVLQEQKQRVLDAPYTELQRYSNVAFGNAPQQSTTTQTGGGK